MFEVWTKDILKEQPQSQSQFYNFLSTFLSILFEPEKNKTKVSKLLEIKVKTVFSLSKLSQRIQSWIILILFWKGTSLLINKTYENSSKVPITENLCFDIWNDLSRWQSSLN